MQPIIPAGTWAMPMWIGSPKPHLIPLRPTRNIPSSILWIGIRINIIWPPEAAGQGGILKQGTDTTDANGHLDLSQSA